MLNDEKTYYGCLMPDTHQKLVEKGCILLQIAYSSEDEGYLKKS